ncbi:hypothetical protein Leryth_018411 [Lithospermum erythrorhizon]|nr:hypothetical protein Leryth_018411 [Lithospermum erythrorhizon]
MRLKKFSGSGGGEGRDFMEAALGGARLGVVLGGDLEEGRRAVIGVLESGGDLIKGSHELEKLEQLIAVPGATAITFLEESVFPPQEPATTLESLEHPVESTILAKPKSARKASN